MSEYAADMPAHDGRASGPPPAGGTPPVHADVPDRGTAGTASGMADRVATFDWRTTTLGPREGWPAGLRTTTSLVLAAKFPMLLLWGPEFIQIYNDAFRPILGATKQPAALGQRARDCWPELWESMLAPLFAHVMEGGEAIWSEDLAIPLDRNGYLEETFFTFSYSAVPDEEGPPAGILVTCVETTARVVSERRLRTLQALAAQASSVHPVADACRMAAATLTANAHDVPFALVYLFEGDEAHLVASAGLPDGHPAAVARLARHASSGEPADAAAWPLPVADAGGPIVTGLAARWPDLPGGPWPEPADAAAVLPIAHAGQSDVLGVLVAGVSARRRADEAYRGFFDLVASQIATAITTARAYEAERQRAEALAQIDRAKTAFFSNVSHEFRTPLTLMIGPTEAAMREPDAALRGESLAMVHRNQLRLLRLVNALLDFSRVEAGRAQAAYRETDLGTATREVAGAFRSAIEGAGLRFDVTCVDPGGPAYVDRGMWETIVLNLLSNALKFTLGGSIRLDLRGEAGQAALTVADTGSGIPAAELPRVFERFHRVEGVRARTHEGSGIGLALTQELVRLHGGTIDVTSREGQGTTFTVRIPLGAAHLPPDRVAGAAEAEPPAGGAVPAAAAFVQESMRWDVNEAGALLSEEAPGPAEDRAADAERILVVDDNADMRDYLRRLLRRWRVATVTHAARALEEARRAPPDLIVSDVMMPDMDGVALLRALRADARTRTVPVLMLSARATEDARITGFDAGADDYLTKPFSGRELVARVRSLLSIARARREAELQKQHLRALFMQAPTPVLVLTGPRHVVDLANPLTCLIWGRAETEVVGRPLLDAMPELRGQPFVEALDQVLRTGGAHVGKEVPAQFDRRGDGSREAACFNFVYAPLRGVDGTVDGVLVLAFDVTDEVRAREEMRELRGAAEAASRAKDEFLAMLGHELRNPLSPILTALQLMRLRGVQGSRAGARR
jgi:PAS domain S-box-containing protein